MGTLNICVSSVVRYTSGAYVQGINEIEKQVAMSCISFIYMELNNTIGMHVQHGVGATFHDVGSTEQFLSLDEEASGFFMLEMNPVTTLVL